MTTYLMGMSGADQTTIHQHGGTTFVGQLLHDDGSVTFDNSTRQAGQSENVTFSTPALASGNVILTHDNPAGDFVVDAINYPTISFHGLATQDIGHDERGAAEPAGRRQPDPARCLDAQSAA